MGQGESAPPAASGIFNSLLRQCNPQCLQESLFDRCRGSEPDPALEREREIRRLSSRTRGYPMLRCVLADATESYASRAVALAAARRHARAGDLRGALRAYSASLELSPGGAEDAQVYTEIGDLLHAQEFPHTAVECYDRSLQLRPESSALWYRTGVIQQRLGAHEDAARRLARALAQLQTTGGVSQPSGTLETARRGATEKGCYFNLGISERALGHSRAALTSFQKVLKLDPQNTAAMTLAAECHEQDRQYHDAMALLDVARTLDPTDYRTRLHFESVAAKASSPDEMIEMRQTQGPSIEVGDA